MSDALKGKGGQGCVEAQAVVLPDAQEIDLAYRQQILSFFRRAGLREEEAQDQTQIVLIKLLHSLEKFRGECSLRTWTYRLAVNVLYDYKNKRREVLLADTRAVVTDAHIEEDKLPEYTPVWGQSAPSPDGYAIQKEMTGKIQKILDQLKPEQKVALLLELDGWSHKEIAAQQKRSVPAIKQALYRTRTQLRKMLEPIAREYGLLK